jgi:hypothetical protein
MNIIMSYDGNDFLKYVRMSLKKSGIFSNKLFKRRIEQNRFYINSLASIAKLLITFYLFSASTKLGPGKWNIFMNNFKYWLHADQANIIMQLEHIQLVRIFETFIFGDSRRANNYV